MKKLPYYKMWVKDFETNEDVKLMDVREAGLYLFALNHAWINDGLPGADADAARLFRVSAKDFREAWPRVCRCFEVCEDGRRRNPRQEEERAEAQSKSKQASAAVAAREAKRHLKGNTETPSAIIGRSSDDHLRAYGSVSGSGSVSENKIARTKPETIADGFDEWLRPWPRVSSPDTAARAWISVVTAADGEAVFACRDRYLASDEVARGAIMDVAKWLFAQAAAKWQGRWPVAIKQPSKESKAAMDERLWSEILEREAKENAG